MAKAIFYKPRPRWHFIGSLAVAVAIELTAVALANIHKEEVIPEVTLSQAPVDAVITELPPESTPPPEEEPPPPPPPPEEPTEFVIQEPTPPPRPSAAPPPKPRPKVAQNKGTSYSGTATYSSSARNNWVSAPRPVYPYEARRTHATGSGKFIITFDEGGNATDVSTAQSTGSPILDSASMNTFRRWRCQPGVYRKVAVPITYTMEGAQL